MKNIKKLLSAMMALLTVSSLTFAVSATENVDTVVLSENDTLVLLSDHQYQVNDGEVLQYDEKIEIKTETANENGFIVKEGTHDIVFKNVEFNNSVVINDDATANIEIKGKNKVTGQKGSAGINVKENATLVLSGKGELTATGSNDGGIDWGNGGAGIGGNKEESSGNITIDGGKKLYIIAQGGVSGAGIGGGYYGDANDITILGGNVKATGGNWAAGIGGGAGSRANCECKGAVKNIDIQGGDIEAIGGDFGDGIGSGSLGAVENITISGGNIKAVGGKDGAGIGARRLLKNITISGGEIKAFGGSRGAGIGSGYRGDGVENITILGGRIKAIGKDGAAGIGSGHFTNVDNIDISGGTIKAVGQGGGAGIGSGHYGNLNNITISGGNLYAESKSGGAGIGSGISAKANNITISGGIIKVRAEEDADPIGNGIKNYNFATVIIDGEELDNSTKDEYKKIGTLEFEVESIDITPAVSLVYLF